MQAHPLHGILTIIIATIEIFISHILNLLLKVVIFVSSFLFYLLSLFFVVIIIIKKVKEVVVFSELLFINFELLRKERKNIVIY